MKRILVWDIPTRLFHWLLAGSFLAAFAFANFADDDSLAFAAHMLLGGAILFMVVWRVIWGFVGSRYSRFRTFAFRPGEVLAYFKGALSGKGKKHVGHNPGSAVAIFTMLGLLVGLALTGAFMSSGGDVLEEIHEVLAWAMMGVVGLHVAGVLWHTLRHRENITLSMFTGKKAGEPEAAIPSARPIAAIVFLALTGLWTGALYTGYDAATSQVTLPVIGATLRLGDGDDHGHDEHERRERDKHDEHDEHGRDQNPR